MKGKLVILSGPSGVGKDTVIQEWQKRCPNVIRVITYTTRPPREMETDGINYHFVAESEFRKLIEENLLLEWKKVHGHWYGSPIREVDSALAEGRIVVLKIDVQGAIEVMRKRKNAISIFLLPPSMEELVRRLKERKQDKEEDIKRRIQDAKGEIEKANLYQYRVVNDSVGRAVEEICQIVRGANPE